MFGFLRRHKRLEARLVEMQAAINTLLERSLLTMSQLDDVLTAIDTATTDIGAKLDVEATAITSVATDMSALRDQLASAPTVTQAVLDRLSAAASKLSGTSSTIASHTAALQAIAADPANPVPTPAPAPASTPAT